MRNTLTFGISFKMRVLLALLFVATAAQALDVDWFTVNLMDIVPQSILEYLKESQREVGEIPSRIVGGDEAVPGQFPYQIGMLVSTAQGTGFCGGSILNEEWILTAAHCVDVAQAVEVIIGAHYVTQQEPEQQRFGVSEIIVHATWNPNTVKDDIALLRLNGRVTFNDRVQPIRLPSRSQTSNNFVRELATVSGWGRDSDSATAISPVLRWTQNPIATNSLCGLYYFGQIQATQICLSAAGRRSSCNGDSGGPLVFTDSDGEVTQIGVVSHGIIFGCESGWPGVYTRVTSYLDWIAENTGGAIAVKN